ncbi:MAG: hypothetical protein P4L40_05995 [Terracidiphilus sp.]|nr:hypothetical protein [Terracidiphilus sp.]
MNEINEQHIGVHVFNRSPSYNAGDDSIVRSQARLLRLRLEEYFENECPTSSMIVIIPKGGYVPVFQARVDRVGAGHSPISKGRTTDNEQVETQTAQPGGELAPVEVETVSTVARLAGENSYSHDDRGTQDRKPSYLLRRILWVSFAILLMATGVMLDRATRMVRAAVSPPTLWHAIFSTGRPVMIVPSDDGLVLVEEFRHAPVNLDEYLSDSYLLQTPAADSAKAGNSTATLFTQAWLSGHQYTSTADLSLAMRLNRLSEAATARVETRYARLLRLDDLKNSNVILIGGIGANPWISLFSHELNFDVNCDWKLSQGYVINKNPQPGELATYFDDHHNGASSSYGVLAYVPGLTGEGRALLFEGSGMAGTEAAADFPFSEENFNGFLKKIGVTPQEPIPYFEVLLETRSVGGNAPQPRVLAWRLIHR